MEANQSPLPGIHPTGLHDREVSRDAGRAADVAVSSDPAGHAIDGAAAIDGRGELQGGVRHGSVMNVIVAGEESGVTRDAFAELGHNAWSCDLKPSRRPGQHWQGSWRDVCWEQLDIGIMHPECTHLAVSGARWFPAKRADGRQQAAIAEFLYLANAPVYASCTEQPVSIMSSLYRKPDQIIQPWMFGRWETKALCYWLKNLPPLVPLYRTVDEAREALGLPAGSKPEARVHRMPPGPKRAEMRSESFPEVAAAMAWQWGGQVESVRAAA